MLASLATEQLLQAASQGEKHHPITDPAIQELLNGVARVGSTAAGSNERKSYMLAQLQSSIVHYGCPHLSHYQSSRAIFPLTLYYAGEEIDIRQFQPK